MMSFTRQEGVGPLEPYSRTLSIRWCFCIMVSISSHIFLHCSVLACMDIVLQTWINIFFSLSQYLSVTRPKYYSSAWFDWVLWRGYGAPLLSPAHYGAVKRAASLTLVLSVSGSFSNAVCGCIRNGTLYSAQLFTIALCALVKSSVYYIVNRIPFQTQPVNVVPTQATGPLCEITTTVTAYQWAYGKNRRTGSASLAVREAGQ